MDLTEYMTMAELKMSPDLRTASLEGRFFKGQRCALAYDIAGTTTVYARYQCITSGYDDSVWQFIP